MISIREWDWQHNLEEPQEDGHHLQTQIYLALHPYCIRIYGKYDLNSNDINSIQS